MVVLDYEHLGDTAIPENTDLGSNKIYKGMDLVLYSQFLSSLQIYGAKYRIHPIKTETDTNITSHKPIKIVDYNTTLKLDLHTRKSKIYSDGGRY